MTLGSTGKRIARRNLVFSIFAENIALSVWLLWSMSAALLVAHYDFGFSAAQMFFLVAVPNLVGSALRSCRSSTSERSARSSASPPRSRC